MKLKILLAGLLCVVLATLGVYIWSLHHKSGQLEDLLEDAIVQRSVALGAVEAQRATTNALIKKMDAQNKQLLDEINKLKPGVKPKEVITSTIELPEVIVPRHPSDGDPNDDSKVTGGTWTDTHGRFTLDLDTYEFRKKQLFSSQVVVLESPAGVQLVNQTFRELDPVTREEITDEGEPQVSTSYSVVSEQPAVNVFHPRVVAGVGYGGEVSVGLGLQILNLEKFGGVWRHANLSLLGMYDTKNQRGQGAAMLGFRPFNWNLSVGPAYFFPSNSVGAAATLELTR